MGKELIKVFTGQRRTGKSYIMYQVMDFIKSEDNEANIIYINKELYEFDHIRDYHKLIKYVNEKKVNSKTSYLFIDEVQEIIEFEKALRSLLAEGNIDIYCSGSNARILSGELATFLAGRYIEINVHALSYSEFLDFNKLENSEKSFERYFKYGGLPYLINLPENEDVIYDYLRNIYAAILYKDIILRQKVRNPFILDSLVKFLAEHTGSIISAKSISDYLKSQKLSVTPNILLNYLTYLTDAYFVKRVKRSDITGKRVFEIGDKFYFEDLGLRHSICGYQKSDIGKILENLVYNYLLQQGYSITTGTENNKEIDFVCERKGEKLYVQVAYIISDEKTRQREFGNLLAIPDNHPKYVVTMDPFTGNTYKGINHVHVKDFMEGSI
ncbi:MAG: ATP-binding protein [Bacteroidales bacterium]|nr:ATP-binding protein [Bacteroidales bacterium]